MATKTGYQNRIELVQGTLDMLILKTLQWGERHGYGISQSIRARCCRWRRGRSIRRFIGLSGRDG